MRSMIVHGFAAVSLGAMLAIAIGTHAQAAAPANYSRACTEVVTSVIASNGDDSFIMHLLFKYLKTLKAGFPFSCDTGELFARARRRRFGFVSRWRVSDTGRRGRPVRRRGFRP